MNLRWGLMVTAVLYVLVVLFMMKTVMTEGIGLNTVLVFAPFLAIVAVLAINSLSAYRIGLLVGTQAMVTYIIPFPLLDRLSIGMVTGMALIGMFLITSAMVRQKSVAVHWNFPSVMLAITAIVVVLRLIFDRPGSARLGSTGGAGEAVAILLGMIVYFVGSKLCATPWDARKNYRATLLISVIAYFPLALEMVKRIIYGYEQLNLYTVPMFSLAAFALVYFLYRSSVSTKHRYKMGLYVLTGLMLVASFVSARRAAPYAAILSILTILFCFRRIKVFLLVGLCLAPLLFGFALLSPQSIPRSMARTLSTVLSKEMAHDLQTKYESLGEIGWESEWRSRLASMAWQDIRQHPFVGRGFAFSFADILAAVAVAGMSRQDALYEGLALSGGYHDGILTMAAFCGLPAAVAMVASMLSLFAVFIWRVRKVAPSPMKMFAAGLAGTFMANFIQMATNGSGPNIYILCALMAVMNGILFKLSHTAEQKSPGDMGQDLLPVPTQHLLLASNHALDKV